MSRYQLIGTLLILAAAKVHCGGLPSIDVGTATGMPGEQVVVQIEFANDGSVTGLQFDVAYDPTIVAPVSCDYPAPGSCSINSDFVRFVAVDFSLSPLPSETLQIEFQIGPEANGNSSLDVLNLQFTDADGASVAPGGISGGSVSLSGNGPGSDLPAVVAGTATAPPGEIVRLPVEFRNDGQVVGYQYDLIYDPAALTALACSNSEFAQCNIDAGSVRYVALSQALDPLPNETVEVSFEVAANAGDGESAVMPDGVVFSDNSGTSVPAGSVVAGAVVIDSSQLPRPEIRARPVFGGAGQPLVLTFEFLNVADNVVAFQFDLVALDPRLNIQDCAAIDLGAVSIQCNPELEVGIARFVALNFSLDPIPSGPFGEISIIVDPTIELPATLELSITNIVMSDSVGNEIQPALDNSVVLVNVRDDILTGSPGSRFGSAVASDGPIMLIGSPGASGGGAVEVLRREGSMFVSAGHLEVPAGFHAAGFGSAVAVQGNTIVVGAPETENVVSKGLTPLAAAVFQRAESGWAFKTALTSASRTPGDRFGESVAISGNTVVVGAPDDSSGAGAAYLYRNEEGLMALRQKVVPIGPVPKGAQTRFGAALAFKQNRLAIGGPGPVGGSLSGTVSLFDMVGGNLVDMGILMSSDALPSDEFGASIAIAGNQLVVGAPGEADGSGTVYLRDFDNLTASPVRVTPRLASAGGRFGQSVALLDDSLTVGAPAAPALDRALDPVSGRTSNFEVGPGDVIGGATRDTGLKALDLERLGSFTQRAFGHSVSVGSGALAVGAPQTMDDSGSITIFADLEFVFRSDFEGSSMAEIDSAAASRHPH